jgi:hypothetical protein
MRRLLMTIGIVGVGLLLAPVTALAAGNGHNGPTVGDCISDGFYGNEPNTVEPEVSGVGPSELEPGTKAHRVVPSQSPGPKVTLPGGTVGPGSSVGDYNQKFGGGFIPALCRAATS